MAELTAELIRNYFLQAGFVQVGFLNKTESNFGNWLDNWLQKGYHAGMNWMEQHSAIRRNPCTIEPFATTIISAAISYKTRPPAFWSEKNPISNYAWGEDYHRVVGRKLQKIKEQLQAHDSRLLCRICVDTAPLAEKIIAHQSGLGWIGKNSLLIHRHYGSYLFLGELVTNLNLASSQPVKDYCGTCRKCIEACPTHAILADRVIDSNRCISYLTIEKRGEFSEQEKAALDFQLFGCDLCQQVCPWNKKAPDTSIESFSCSEKWNCLSTDNPPAMTIELYNELKIKSAIKRTKYEGLVRNLKAISETKRSTS